MSLSHAGPGVRPGTPPVLLDSRPGGAAAVTGAQLSLALPRPHRPVHEEPALPPGSVWPRTHSSFLSPHARLRPPRQLPRPLHPPHPPRGSVAPSDKAQAQGGRRHGERARGSKRQAAIPEVQAARGARPDPERGRKPLGGRKGWGAAAEARGRPGGRGPRADPGRPPWTPRRSRTFL